MAPSLQAIIVLAACCMVVIVSSSAELAEPPSPSTTAAATASLHRSGQLYTMNIRVGETTVSCIADTGSDLIWTRNSQFDSSVSCPSEEKCKCITCCRSESGKEMDMNCGYGLTTFERKYGDDLPVRGVVGEAKLTTFVQGEPTYTTPSALYIGSAVMCGCHLSSTTTQDSMPCRAYKRGGIVGLDRGEMSLVRQLGLHRFSYCLPYKLSQATAGLLKLNDAAAPLEGSRETGLVRVEELPYPISSRYYVRLKEIAIGSTGTTVSLHNGCFDKDRASGNGGMVIDLGTAFSALPKDVKSRVEKEVEKLMETATGKEPERVEHHKFSCYKGTYPEGLGNIELRFCDGSAMEIPAENYFYSDKDSFCLAFDQTYGDKDQMAILGAYQQQGMHMLFDIEGNTLSFAKHSGTCGQAQEENHATM